MFKDHIDRSEANEISAGNFTVLKRSENSALELARKANQTIARMKADAKKKAEKKKPRKSNIETTSSATVDMPGITLEMPITRQLERKRKVEAQA